MADPDPGSGAFLTPGSGMGKIIKILIRDLHISESLEQFLWLKILKFFYADPDPGSGIFLTRDPGKKKIRIRDKHPGSATLAVDGLSYVWLVASPFFFCQKAV